MSCGVGCRCGLDPALLCSGIAIAIAPIQPLSWEPPYASGVALKRKKKKKRKKKERKEKQKEKTKSFCETKDCFLT